MLKRWKYSKLDRSVLTVHMADEVQFSEDIELIGEHIFSIRNLLNSIIICISKRLVPWTMLKHNYYFFFFQKFIQRKIPTNPEEKACLQSSPAVKIRKT